MSKKHYIRLASDIRVIWNEADENQKKAISDMLDVLCDSLKSDNRNFQRETFIFAATGQ